MKESTIRQQIEMLRAAKNVLSDDFISDAAQDFQDALSIFDRCPFKVGDKVMLSPTFKPPTEESAPGWMFASHFLVKGATAVVCSRDFKHGSFRFSVKFDNDSSKHYSTGKLKPTAFEDRGLFMFREDQLEKSDEHIEAL